MVTKNAVFMRSVAIRKRLVMITHNEEIAQMADRILQIEDGKIVSDSGLV